MTSANLTGLNTFFLLGFQGLQDVRFFLFSSLLMVYVATILGNLLILALVYTNSQLHHPMYYFLSHLSSCDLILTSSVSPLALQVILHNGSNISVIGCIAQFYIFGTSLVIECLLLTIMSYDRYLAICHPLRYSITMTFQLCHCLMAFCWFLGVMVTLIIVILISDLSFCRDNVIDHFFCDFAPLIQLACSDTSILEMVVLAIATPETFFEVFFIICTYICIVVAILQISSTTGRQKAFSTCSSHLSTVCMYYGTLIAIYVSPSRGQSIGVKKILSLLYTVVPPLFNPYIYSLKNQEIRAAIKKWI
ncbi:olfactory receptor 5L1-like [Anomaloglossus baeobatrachus]|uniref:olfactory receptor 5L1-like n=1 Tax=Anomaloglossus baeobatrachus TaxID=238106 RepID=UPI003F4FE3E8